MTKELSKQLCELCEIEPEIYGNWCYEVGSYGCGNCSRGYGSVCAENCTKCEYYEKEHETYPDFGQPENCVKLIELKINFDDFFCTRKSTIKSYINLYRTQHIKCKNLDDIEILIKAVNGDFEDNNNIKQSIREAEWKYE